MAVPGHGDLRVKTGIQGDLREEALAKLIRGGTEGLTESAAIIIGARNVGIQIHNEAEVGHGRYGRYDC